jgi:hypothetical protein
MSHPVDGLSLPRAYSLGVVPKTPLKGHRLRCEVQNDNQYGYQDCRRQYGNNILSHVLLLLLLSGSPRIGTLGRVRPGEPRLIGPGLSSKEEGPGNLSGAQRVEATMTSRSISFRVG